jgi:sulfite exporter TauE/SafE/copper chaperone CopZ
MIMKKITLHVGGTHCKACKILIEDILNEQSGVKNTQVDLRNETVTFETDTDSDIQTLMTELNEKIKPNGHTLSVERNKVTQTDNTSIWPALGIGLMFLLLFFVLQKSGILNFGVDGTITPMTSFIIGLIASVSSCLAVVGGLILALSAKVAKDDKNNKRPIYLFHVGRLVSFAVLGGVLGAIGGVFGVSMTFGAILGIIASLVMVLLGLNLVGLLQKNTIALPIGIFNFFRKIEHQTLAPLLVGMGTFFLPCGFTQAMQIAALSSESFISGSLIMLAFALGTLPMLALLSFGSSSFAQSKYAPLFFKSAGVIVIGLGLFSLLAGLAGLGVIEPLFTI